MNETAANPNFKPAHVIVVGNEKGGSGKTTTTMHLIVALLRLGFSVGSIDIDSRQRSLTRYFENRRQTVAKQGVTLPMPHHIVIQKSPFNSAEEAKADERDRFAKGLARIYGTCDFVVIDTPGNDTYLSRLAHSFASTVITPINDSFVDLDVLASVDGETLNIVKPSIYAEMVWEQKLQRAKRDGGSIDWIVMRNRLSNIDARNKRFMTKVMEELARRIGFRVAPGFSERVIFREMFLQGLTVLDVLETDNGGKLSISHVAARQEVRSLLQVLKIPAVDQRIEKLRTGEAEEEVKSAAETLERLKSETDDEAASSAASGSSQPAAASATKPVDSPPVKPAEPALSFASPVSVSVASGPALPSSVPSGTSTPASVPFTLDAILNAPVRNEIAPTPAPVSVSLSLRTPSPAPDAEKASAASTPAHEPTMRSPSSEPLRDSQPSGLTSRGSGPTLNRVLN